MLKVIWTERKTNVLSPSSLACLARIPALNLTSGCAHECIYCYARGYSSSPGDNKVIAYKDTLDRLKNELPKKRTKPRAVYFSPSSDLFQPIPEFLELTHALLECLLSTGIGVSFITKGQIPPKTIQLLLDHAEIVRAQIGLITCDDNIRLMLEPNAASIDTRLDQMSVMAAGGISVEARVMPIIPGITDSIGSAETLFGAIYRAGIKTAPISTLFLRPAIAASIKRHISDAGAFASIMSFFSEGRRIPVHAQNSSVIPVDRQKREDIYSRISVIARRHRIVTSVCGCMNPDIRGSCNITGHWPEHMLQPALFV